MTQDDYIGEMMRIVVKQRNLATPVPDDAAKEFRAAVIEAIQRVTTPDAASDLKDKVAILRGDYAALRERVEALGEKIVTNSDAHFGYRLAERMARRGLPSPGAYLLSLLAAIDEEIERQTPRRGAKAKGHAHATLFWAAMNLWLDFAHNRPAKSADGPFMVFVIAFHGVIYGEEYTGTAYERLMKLWKPIPA